MKNLFREQLWGYSLHRWGRWGERGERVHNNTSSIGKDQYYLSEENIQQNNAHQGSHVEDHTDYQHQHIPKLVIILFRSSNPKQNHWLSKLNKFTALKLTNLWERSIPIFSPAMSKVDQKDDLEQNEEDGRQHSNGNGSCGGKESDPSTTICYAHTFSFTFRKRKVWTIRDEEKSHHKANDKEPLKKPKPVLQIGPWVLTATDAYHDQRKQEEKGSNCHADPIGCQVAHDWVAR